MATSAFRVGFDRDLVRTAIADADLGGRVLQRTPKLDGAGPAELIAGGRALRGAGGLGGKAALKVAGALLDLALHEEALDLLQDDTVDFKGREHLRRLALARGLAAAGDPAGARANLAKAETSGAVAGVLAQALAAEPIAASEAPPLAGELAALGLTDLAADILIPCLDAAETAAIEAAFGVLRLCGPAAAGRLVQAMARPFRLEGREASLRATLQVLEGGDDAGVEEETEGSSRLKLLLRACLAEACAAAGLWPAAIRRFDYAGKKWREPADSLPELARCVGRDVLDRRPVRLLPPSPDDPPKMVDLFPYNGEARLLQLKLGEMAPWVDRFVLVEADETFPGRPKPLYFHDDPDAAAGRFSGRIVPVTVPRPPSHIDFTWAREFFQKDCAVFGLEDLCRPDDVVILSDADEILDRAAVQGFSGDVAAGALRTFRYFLNCELISNSLLLKATVTRARYAAVHGWNYLRLGAIRYRRSDHLPGAGWHFSSIGDAAWLAYKMQCTAHEEWSYQDHDFFARFLRKMRKEGGLGADFVRREIDDSFPASLREARGELEDFIL